jgi:ribosomal protein L12E/L44/L45/RPP1/RPP2
MVVKLTKKKQIEMVLSQAQSSARSVAKETPKHADAKTESAGQVEPAGEEKKNVQ